MSRRSMRVGAIVRKDLHALWPMVAVAIGLTVADFVVAAFSLGTPALREILPSVTKLGWAFLITAAIQQDTAVSVSHDWLTKPISRLDVVLAKGAFIALTVLAPIVLVRVSVYATQGYSGAEAVLTALNLDPIWFLMALPLLVAVAAVTPTLLQSIAAMFGLFALIFLVPTVLMWLGLPMLDESIMWPVVWPIVFGALGTAAAVLWLAYARRNTRAARATLAGVPVAFLLAATLIGWQLIFAVQKAVGPDASLGERVELALNPGCFPSQSVDAVFAAGPVSATQPRFVGAGVWTGDELDRLREAGPHAVAFATGVAPRDVEKGWRMRIVHADATYRDAGGNVLARAYGRFAPAQLMSLDGSAASAQFWLLSGDAVEHLKTEPTVKLELDYVLSLLEPSVAELATDGRRRQLPHLGYCAATHDPATSTIEIDCFKRGAQPSLVRAAIPGAPLRVAESAEPDYMPGWLEPPFLGRRTKLELQVPAGVDPAKVQLTVYEVRSIFERRVEAPGILNGSAEACPVPSGVAPPIPAGRSVWRDTSPHTTSFVNVADGVRLEVLDWGGRGRPLLLIPGLGATAHSFDDFAPKLAQRYRVLGMTRRGNGASTRAETGYDTPRLAEDVVRVLDALELDASVVVAGHSIAGIELDELGARHSERVAGLVYLDAAFDRTRPPSKELDDLRRTLPQGPRPEPAELASYPALVAYMLRMGGVGLPEGEVLATFQLTPAGSVGGRNFDPRILDAIEDGVLKPDYRAFKVPALAINALPRDAEGMMMPWLDRADPALRATMQRLYEVTSALREANKRDFLDGIASSRAVDILGASHFVFSSNEAEVLAAIDAFTATLP